MQMRLSKFKIQVKEFTFDNETYYKLVEKGYILGVRLYTDEYPKKYYVLANAISAANRHYAKLEKENLVGLNGTKTVWTIE